MSTKKQQLLTKIIDLELETFRIFKEGKIKALRYGKGNTAITFDQSIATSQKRIDFFINQL